MKNKILKPTESELLILQVLWEYGPCSVRFVNDKINEKRKVGYTTTLKLMQIMVAEKGLAKRDTKNRTHIYSANVDESETQKRLLEKFVDVTFKGSAMKLVMRALGNHDASKEELDEIKAMIEKIEKQGK